MADTLIAIRVTPNQWLDDDVFARLLTFLGHWSGTIDEIVLFTSATHAPLPLAEVERRSIILGQRMLQARARGYRIGINVLATIGHHEENLPYSLAEPWPRVTDLEGRVSWGSYCPGSPALLGYVARLYRLMAQAGPDFIWVDDDVRLLGHMPIKATCFCDDCICRFSHAVGASFTRESLARILQSVPSANRDVWRSCWLQHNRQLVTALLHTIEQAVHQIDPRIQIGFMTGDRFYEGYAFTEWASALEGPQSGPARWRPGGGFYADDAYMGLVEKAHEVGRQVSQLPAPITIIQSEIENFPYHKLRKSVEITVLEAAAHMASGATGLAFNILTQHADPLDEYEPFLDRIAQARHFFHSLREATLRAPTLGVWPAWNRDVFVDSGGEGNWFEANATMEALRRPYVLAELGIPIAYTQEHASVTALAGPLPAAFSHESLQRIFQKGVLMDARALQTLTYMGVSEWTGVRLAGVIERDVTEMLSNHPFNGQFGGWSRDCRQSFWPQPAYRLESLAPEVQVLAHLKDYANNDWGPSMTAYENDLGGRVVVMGYYPWTLVHNLAKSSQIKAICQWLSWDTLPAIATTYARSVVWARRSHDGILTIIVLNASLDPAPHLALRVRAIATSVRRLDIDRGREELATIPDGQEHVRVVLRNVKPWSIHLLQVL